MMKTRTLQFRDGRCEIVRILSTEDLAAWSDVDPLAYEKSIVWLEDIETLPYVRTLHVRCATSRRGRLHLSTGERVVGYAKLMPDAPRHPETSRFTRRLFYLKEDDSAATAPVPTHAVDPRSVLPGVSGVHPYHARPRRAAQ